MSFRAHYSLITIPLLLGAVSAAPLRKDTFVEALAEAKKTARPVAVFVHGSSWHTASKNFGQKIWNNPEFTAALTHPVILTNIHIRQNLDKKTAAAEAAKYKGWNARTLSTYPAIQLYAPDDHLLKHFQGRDLRVLTTPASLASHLDQLLGAAAKRTTLLKAIADARSNKDTKSELKHLTALVELPFNNEPKIIEQLKKADPADTSGWQARLTFKGWGFVRHITGLINNKKSEQALKEIDALLKSPGHTPAQRALILGAKGKTLVAREEYSQAWEAYQQAHQADPNGPNGKAMLSYGIRTARSATRDYVPGHSALHGKKLGANLTRDHATATLSSDYDGSGVHPSLFKGPPAARQHAFHTKNEKDAHVIIDLKAACTINALHITNRGKLRERADSLTLWTSTDRKTWAQVWQASAVKPSWDILLEKPLTARYLKIGLSGRSNFLHLRTIDAYGTRP